MAPDVVDETQAELRPLADARVSLVERYAFTAYVCAAQTRRLLARWAGGGVMTLVSGYDGFISYSHQDDAVLGPALQTSLERFAKPWYKMRVLRIFLDTADLGANPGLWPSIVDGLSSSKWFILLASPGAAGSRWVDREIQWWVENAPLQRLLVVATSPGLAWDDQAQDWAASAPVPRCPRPCAACSATSRTGSI